MVKFMPHLRFLEKVYLNPVRSQKIAFLIFLRVNAVYTTINRNISELEFDF